MKSVMIKYVKRWAKHVIVSAREKKSNDELERKGKMYALDASTMDLGWSGVGWGSVAKNESRKKMAHASGE